MLSNTESMSELEDGYEAASEGKADVGVTTTRPGVKRRSSREGSGSGRAESA
jgi:hypothetical protein